MIALSSTLRLIVSTLGSLVCYGLYRVIQLFYQAHTSSFRLLPGPPPTSWLTGNLTEIQATENTIFYTKWTDEYGPTMRFRLLYTADIKALNHILLNEYIYHKPHILQWSLGRISGPGLFYVQDGKHKIQRKIMSPAFGPSQLREFTGTFLEKANELKDIWASKINESVGNDEAQVDALSWLSRATLDVIGRTGFNYDFHALTPKGGSNELSKAFSTGFHVATRLNFWLMIQGTFPFTRWIPSPGSKSLRYAKKTMNEIGQNLLDQTRAHLNATGEKAETWRARDLLSLLVRSNMNKDIADSQRMSDVDVIAQVPTFLIAGHDTTSASTTWALYALSNHKAVQDKLRDELLSVPTEQPTMEDLNALPYLDAVVRETLRVHSPAPESARVALHIKKGQHILMAIAGVNLSKELWGEDAMEFKPERWASLPKAVSLIPGVFGNLMTFLGGMHGCIGYRFAVLEMKVLLFVLVRAFQVTLAVPKEEIISQTSLVQRPYVRGRIEAGEQLPLLIRPCSREEK
ncbi:cytochrome P450 [Rhodocollybia butyracea]|uniref:Cytochrome P450 n=1 Tax=Rhodocollybia butyracea TaxID=206335 RepID=A0A9P5PRY5_9AGAR|nr:cytochrome P450 [Rhodocollybia butyracea]